MNTFLRRTVSTVVLLTFFFASVFWKGSGGLTLFSILAVLLSYFAVREFVIILKKSGNPVDLTYTPLFAGLTVIFALFHLFGYAIIIAGIVVVHNWLLFLTSKNEKTGMQSILNSTGSYFLFTVPVLMLVYIYLRSPMLFLYLVLVTKISDIGAYVTGTACNAVNHGHNHKMIPSISPGKSYEGAIGGIICAVLASCIIWPYCGIATGFLFAILAGIILFFGSVAGDLSESAFKRTCGVKDSGNFLPGIGGIFDLVDSLLINSVIFFIFLYLLA